MNNAAKARIAKDAAKRRKRTIKRQGESPITYTTIAKRNKREARKRS
jgi:hypothetical protein